MEITIVSIVLGVLLVAICGFVFGASYMSWRFSRLIKPPDQSNKKQSSDRELRKPWEQDPDAWKSND